MLDSRARVQKWQNMHLECIFRMSL